MNDYKSIYTNHYEGPTYRFAFAYLVDNSRRNQLNPKRPSLTLDEQRDRIAAYAKEHGCIVVKEFIEKDGEMPLRDREGFLELAVHVAYRYPTVVIHAGRKQLNLRAGERYLFTRQLELNGLRVTSSY